MEAASESRTDTVQLLLSFKADPNLQDKEGSTALKQATEESYLDIVDLLKKAGAKR